MVHFSNINKKCQKRKKIQHRVSTTMAFLRLINALALLQIRWKLRATYTPAAIMKRKDGIALPSHLCWCSLELHHSVLSLAPESQKPPTPQRQSICSSLRGEATPSIAFDINAVPTMTTLQLAAGAGRRRRNLVALLLLCLAVAGTTRAGTTPSPCPGSTTRAGPTARTSASGISSVSVNLSAALSSLIHVC
jgi:hypothetical protein